MIRLPPPPLLAPALSRLVAQVLDRHPEILRRMGDQAARAILIDCPDLPCLVRITPATRRATLHRSAPEHDACIKGRLSVFLAMLHGEEDGDALFFSGALQISGDTSAVLALRNALDAAEIDLAAELSALTRLNLTPLARALGPRLGLSLHRSL